MKLRLTNLYSTMYAMLSLIILMTVVTPIAAASAKSKKNTMTISIETTEGTGDEVMIVIWAESKKGFTRTLYWFSGDDEWFPDLTTWEKKRAKTGIEIWADEPGIDAIIGPTIGWEEKKSCTIPLVVDGVNILDGKHRLRIEQRQDGGGHYKKFKLPLKTGFKGGSLDEFGYIKKLSIKVNK